VKYLWKASARPLSSHGNRPRLTLFSGRAARPIEPRHRAGGMWQAVGSAVRGSGRDIQRSRTHVSKLLRGRHRGGRAGVVKHRRWRESSSQWRGLWARGGTKSERLRERFSRAGTSSGGGRRCRGQAATAEPSPKTSEASMLLSWEGSGLVLRLVASRFNNAQLLWLTVVVVVVPKKAQTAGY
jgi:hypothetical protein